MTNSSRKLSGLKMFLLETLPGS